MLLNLIKVPVKLNPHGFLLMSLILFFFTLSSSREVNDSLESISDSIHNKITKKKMNYLPALAFSGFIPGGGQAYHGYYWRAAGMFALEAALWYSGFSRFDRFNNKYEEIDRLESLSNQTNDYKTFLPSLDSYTRNDTLYRLYRDSLDYVLGRQWEDFSFMWTNFLWAGGAHIYNTLDMMNIVYHSRNKCDQYRSPVGAAVRSLILPGWGQFYNQEYGKMGLVIMAEIGMIGSMVLRHNVGKYYEGLEAEYLNLQTIFADMLDEQNLYLENRTKEYDSSLAPVDSADTVARQAIIDSFTRDSTEIQNRINNAGRRKQNASDNVSDHRQSKVKYYSKRNAFIWYLVALYLYAVYDAVVDAHLHDFDSRSRISLIPLYDGLVLNINFNF
jgi:hypothetical protein